MIEQSGADTDALRLRLLVLGCQAGDERAFARLMERFGPGTLRYLRSLVGDDAEDVQQEVWLAVYRQVSGLVDAGAFRTWLFRTARHRAIDSLRRRRREQALFDHEADVEIVADPQGDAAAELDLAGLGGVIEKLPPLQREAVQLRYGDGLSYGEIALVVGCPVGTVRSRLFHARRRLEQLLTKET